jgi:hypothetical protein
MKSRRVTEASREGGPSPGSVGQSVGVKYRITFEEREPEIVLLIALFEPGEGLILVACNLSIHQQKRGANFAPLHQSTDDN